MRRLATISAILSVAAAIIAVLLWRDAQRRRQALLSQAGDTPAPEPWYTSDPAAYQAQFTNGDGAAPAQPAQPAAPAAEKGVGIPTNHDNYNVGDMDGEDGIVTQRVRSNLGHEPRLSGLPHFNVNTEKDGVVYLRGVVHNEEQRQVAEQIARQTEGVQDVVNELELAQDVNG